MAKINSQTLMRNELAKNICRCCSNTECTTKYSFSWNCTCYGLQSAMQVLTDFPVGKDIPNTHIPNLGRSKGGFARSEKLTSERRKEIAIKAANVRWHKDGK